MKKTLFVLITLLLVGVGTIWSTENSESKNIIINKDTSKDLDKDRPRDLIVVPVFCTYNNATLFFSFLEDLGELDIIVTNLSTGSTSIYEYDSAFGSVVFGVSSNSGAYLIRIITESGDYYYGEYTL